MNSDKSMSDDQQMEEQPSAIEGDNNASTTDTFPISEPSTSQLKDQSTTNQPEAPEATHSEPEEKRLKCTETLPSNQTRKYHTQPFQCEVCKRNFNSKYRLTRHMSTHTAKNPYDCDMCNLIFTSHVHLKQHALMLHPEQKPFVCRVCKERFAYNSELKLHMHSHTDSSEKPFKCKKCEEKFAREEEMLAHVKTHPRKKRFFCGICNTGFVTMHNRTRHLENRHKVFCKKKFVNEPVILKEMVMVLQFRCKLCNKLFHLRKELKEHRKTNHQHDKKWFTCTRCFKMFESREDVLDHAGLLTCESENGSPLHMEL